jgi:pimeloyl-ACP methyl ester carboxylesterase
MPFAHNLGVKIHYEVEGDGPPLVLQYGQYFPLDVWYEYNYVRVLKEQYRLILVDARGHGLSDKPYDPDAYRLSLMVKDILAVLDDLGIEKMNYMGYSSGGYLGFAIARDAPERCSSLILGGTHPYEDDHQASLAWREEQIRSLEKQSTADFVSGLEAFISSIDLPPLSARMRMRLLTHDTRALIAWNRGSGGWEHFDDVIRGISIPCTLYAGEKSGEFTGAQRAAREIPGATFVVIPGGEHLEGGTWISILKPYIDRLVKGNSNG